MPPDGLKRVPTCPNFPRKDKEPEPSSCHQLTGGDRDHAGVACDFDVIAWGSRIKTLALHPHVVACTAESLIVEEQFGDPALEVDSYGDFCWTPNGDL